MVLLLQNGKLLLQSTTQNLPVQVNAVWQQMVLLLQSYLVRACVRACLDAAAEGAIYDY